MYESSTPATSSAFTAIESKNPTSSTPAALRSKQLGASSPYIKPEKESDNKVGIISNSFNGAITGLNDSFINKEPDVVSSNLLSTLQSLPTTITSVLLPSLGTLPSAVLSNTLLNTTGLRNLAARSNSRYKQKGPVLKPYVCNQPGCFKAFSQLGYLQVWDRKY